jgi:hypothetical protein
MSQRALRIKSLEAELGEILPDAARRLGCNERQLRSELVMEERGERVYRVRGCDLGTTYKCRSRIVERQAVASCHQTTSGAPI